VAIRFRPNSMRSPGGVCWCLPWRRPVQLVQPVCAGERPAWPHRVRHPHPLLNQPGCPMLGSSRRAHCVGGKGEDGGDTSAGEYCDGRVLFAGLHHNNAKKSTAARTQCDPISLEVAPARFDRGAGS
jgi:hypothetical protein